jgi:WD40 repeat protein
VSPYEDLNDGDFVSVWDMETRERIAHLTEYPDRVYGLSFSPCGRFLAVGCWGGTLRVWDLVTGKLEMSRTDYGKYRMYPKYLQDGRLIAAGLYHYHKQEPVEVWDIEPNEKLETIELRANVNCARFSDCGTQLAVASHGEIKVWTRGQPARNTLSTLQGHNGFVRSVVFSQDGRTLAAGVQRDNVLLWDLESGDSQRALDTQPPTDYVVSYIVHRTPAGKIFAMGITRQEITKIRVWDVGNSRFPISEFRTPPKKFGLQVEFSPKADQLVKGDRNGRLSVWDVCSGQERYAFTAHTSRILALAFSTDGERIVSTASDGTARLWATESGEAIGELPVPALLDASQYKGDVEEIQNIQEVLSKGNTPRRPPQIGTLIFSPQGTVIAGGIHKEIRLWDTQSYETQLAILLPPGCQKPRALAFSPCGRYLASGSWWQGTDKVSIRLWKVSSGENVATFWGHTTDVQSLAFSPDSALLASGSYDGTILLWDMKPYL